MTNLKLHSDLKDEAAELSYLFPKSHMKESVIVDLDKINRLLKIINLHHKQKRELNALGIILKYITETLDNDDFERLLNTEEQIIKEQDR